MSEGGLTVVAVKEVKFLFTPDQGQVLAESVRSGKSGVLSGYRTRDKVINNGSPASKRRGEMPNLN